MSRRTEKSRDHTIAAEVREPCPYCGIPLESWRHDLAAKSDPELIIAAVENNRDLKPAHAIYHIPESL